MKYSITPVPAPRMTQRDKWAKRPCVMRYFAFRDEVRLHKVKFNSGNRVAFNMPMPRSWSKKKKAAMVDMPHTQKPDLDNLLKSLLDSIYEDDAHIYALTARKFWAYEGSIVIEGNE